MIYTDSAFWYGIEVTELTDNFIFQDNGPLVDKKFPTGGYSHADFILSIQTFLNSNSELEYTVTIDRQTRFITISTIENFDLLFGQSGTTIAGVMGFDSVDLTGFNSYTSAYPVGEIYLPQFRLQDYVDFDDYEDNNNASVNVSASGVTEVVTFSTSKFMECNIKYANNYEHHLSSAIEENLTGVEDLRRFMSYVIKKENIEFFPDRNDLNTFKKVILEKTRQSSKGTGYKLKELYGRGLNGYYETGTLTFKEVS